MLRRRLINPTLHPDCFLVDELLDELNETFNKAERKLEMVQLNINIEENAKASGSAPVKVDDGWHKGIIVRADMAPSLIQGGQDDLVLTHVITEGPFAHTEIERRLSILDTRPIKADKPEWTWQKAAHVNLAKLAQAVGLTGDLTDTNHILNKPILFSTVTKQGRDRNTGELKPEWDRSEVRDYKPVAGGTVAATQAPAQPTEQPQTQQQTAAPQSAPWG